MTGDEAEPPFLSATGLSKTYTKAKQSKRQALMPLDFQVAEGEFRSLVGPSGCGKTTLMKILAGLTSKTTGKMQFRGAVGGIPARDMGIVFQTPALLPWRTVESNVMLPPELLRIPKRSLRKRADHLLNLVHLDGHQQSLPGELSGGMQQRASIARALIHDPSILFMDEPFGALDAMTRDTLNVELQTLHLESKKTIVFVTHSIPEAVFLSDNITILSASPGRILDTIPVKLSRPRSIDIQESSEFQRIVHAVRNLLAG